MANYEKLYKKLHEEFELEFNEDFWRHKQSGKYIITHNAVKKIVAQQRKKGFVIQTPKTNEIVTTTANGPDGEEIVKQADFYLLDSDGNVLRHEAAIGEANEKNCRLAFRHTMAHKRMYDRGCLSLLQIAELGGYSDVEAEDFSKSKNKTKEKTPPTKPTGGPPLPKKQPVEAAEQAAPPVPAPRPPVRLAPTISAPKKSEPDETVAEGSVGIDLVISFIEKTNTDESGATVGQITNVMHETGENIDVKASLKAGIEMGFVYRTGERRATRYHIKTKDNGVLTRKEFDELWTKVTQSVRENNIQYKVLSQSVYAVTKHDTAISAFQSGNLTKEGIEEIQRLCIVSSNTQECVG